MTTRRPWATATAASAVVLVLLTAAVLTGTLDPLDQVVADWVIREHEPWLGAAMGTVTRLGGSAVLAPAALSAAGWVSRRRRSWWPLDPGLAARTVAIGDDRLIDLGVSSHGCFLHVLSVGIVADFAAAVRAVHGRRRRSSCSPRPPQVLRRRICGRGST